MEDRKILRQTLQQRLRRALIPLVLSAIALPVSAHAASPGTASPRAAAPNACTRSPAAPTGLVASGTVGLGTFLHWSAVATPSGCSVSYTVSQNGAVLGSTTNTSFAVTGLAHATTYGFTVSASDAAGSSNPSSILNVATPAPAGNDFFVAKTGSDSKGSGSQASPWASIGHAVSLAQPGDTVYVGAGVYSESVTLSTSGTAAAPIVIDGQGAAIVDGSQVACCTSPAFASSNGFIGASTEGLFNIGSKTAENYVTVEGFTIQSYATSNDTLVPAGILIASGGTGINILNNIIQNIHAASSSNANAYGIGVFGISATPLSVTVSYNTVTGCLTGLSETTTFNGNVQNFVVSYNNIYGNDNIGMDAIGFEGVGPAGADQAKNGDVYGNVIYNNSGVNNPGYASGGPDWGEDGLYCDGCAQVVFERNTVYGNDIGIEAASEIKGKLSSNVIIRNNLVYGSNSAGITVGGYAKNGTGGSSNVTIVNNSLYDDDLQNTGTGEFQVQYRATGITFENNVVYAGAGGIFLNGYVPNSGVTLDHNDYYTTSSTTQFKLNNSSYATFAKYRQGTGQDQNSVFADPTYLALPSCSATGLVPTGGGKTAASSCTTPANLDLLGTSPAWNAGNSNLGSPAGSGYSSYENSQPFVGLVDFGGNSRVNANGQINIGAYEQ
jgi:hypothetical protein